MTYKNLKNFQKIFSRADFNYVSEHVNIYEISELILLHASYPDGKEQDYIFKLESFLNNMASFINWINGKKIKNIENGYHFSEQILSQVLRILKQPDFKRTAISGAYLKKFNKVFLYGLSAILKGIRTAFNPDVVSSTRINEDQLRRYILDKIEGLGKKYLFNTTGRDAFVNKIGSLNRYQLIIVERLLFTLPSSQLRKYNNWLDLGLGNTPVRILIRPRSLRKDEVYFLFMAKEHSNYTWHLNSRQEFGFLAA